MIAKFDGTYARETYMGLNQGNKVLIVKLEYRTRSVMKVKSTYINTLKTPRINETKRK